MQAAGSGPAAPPKLEPAAAATPLGPDPAEAGQARDEISPRAPDPGFEPDPSDPVSAIRSLLKSGDLHRRRTEFAAAEADLRAALDRARALHPQQGLALVAEAHLALGLVDLKRGQPESADTHLRAGRELLADSPPTLVGAQLLHYQGVFHLMRGQESAARGSFARALDSYLALDEQGEPTAEVLMFLGIADLTRGDLRAADAHFVAAGTIYQRLAPGDPKKEAWVLQNRGLVAQARRDFDTAESFLQRSYALRRVSDSMTLPVAISLSNLASLALDREDPITAQRHLQEALPFLQQQMPGTLDLAYVLADLGRAATLAGDRTGGEAYHRQAQVLFDKLAPMDVDTARNRMFLGLLEHAGGHIEEGRNSLERAVTLLLQRAPASTALAQALDALAILRLAGGDRRQAVGLLEEAIEALEKQRRLLGGTREGQARFGAHFADIYHRLLALQVELGETGDAFRTLERYRAQGLRHRLAEDGLDLSRGLPPELLRRRDALNREYEAASERLENLPADAPPGVIDAQLAALETLRRQRADLFDEIRRRVPRFAVAEPPEALDAQAVQATLDPGTTLLSYAVTEAETFLFVLRRDGNLQLFRLGMGEAALADQVRGFLDLLQVPTAATLPGLQRKGRELYRLLVPEALAELDRGEGGREARWLILPDGPLHRLPFGALVLPDAEGDAEAPRYLVEERPLYTALSATVHAATAPGQPRMLVAVGDPGEGSTPMAQGETLRGGGAGFLPRPQPNSLSSSLLSPLPDARREAEAVTRLFPGPSRLLLGREATEAAIKALDLEVSHLHLACHAEIDERFPLDSYLALAPAAGEPGQGSPTAPTENGRLHAWEIYEELRLDADLVILSACETARGQGVGGDGVLGLAQAFRHAGAQAVLASLWRVSDRSTAPLMESFYRHLAAGRSKDEALALAQRDAIRSGDPNLSHPYHWAAFLLIGNRR